MFQILLRELKLINILTSSLTIINSNQYSNQSERSITQVPKKRRCLGPVHTSAFSNVCVFVRPKTHRLIRVHTTVFAAFSTAHTNTLENDV